VNVLRICGLLLLLSAAAISRTSAALGDGGEPAADFSEYVYLHETRSQSAPLQIAAHANMCRGSAREPRS
jgi:hypothetical protein